MPLYWQLIAMCWLALAARLTLVAGAALAAAMVAPTTNKVPGIAASRTSFMSTLRMSWSPAGHVPALRCAELPGGSVTPHQPRAKDLHARARRGRGPGFRRSRACLRPRPAGHTYDQGLAERRPPCLA